jgi:hypothetical protein
MASIASEDLDIVSIRVILGRIPLFETDAYHRPLSITLILGCSK